MGSSANSGGKYSISIGSSSTANQDGSIALGYTANANSTNSIALGREATIGDTGSGAVVLGYQANANSLNAVAIGSSSKVEANTKKSVALGYQSEVLTTDLLSSDSWLGIVSVGNDNYSRRIVHVGKGINSTDALNVGQVTDALNSVLGKGVKVSVDSSGQFKVSLDSSSTVNGIGNTGKTNISDAIKAMTVSQGGVDWSSLDDQAQQAIQAQAKIAMQGIAFGGTLSSSASATSEGSLAIGQAAEATNEGAVAIGSSWIYTNSWDNSVTTIDGARAGQGAIAIGSGSRSEYFSTAVGTNATATGQRSVAIGDGSESDGLSSISIGGAYSSKYGSLAIGTLAWSTGNHSIAIGSGSKASAENSIALGLSASVDSLPSVALGSYSTVGKNDVDSTKDSNGVISVGRSSSSATGSIPAFTRRIINVSSGLHESDASTVGQIKQGLNTILGDGVTVAVDSEGNFTVNLDSSMAGLGGTGKATISEAIQAIASGSVDLTEINSLISTNTSSIATNKSAIETNAAGIATNKGKIEANTTSIDQLVAGTHTGIDAEAWSDKLGLDEINTSIALNKADIASNLTKIQTNATDIATNKSAIETNASGIATNKSKIEANTSTIRGLDTRVTANFNAIEALEAGMVDWSSLSADAQTAIQAQATVAAKNAIKVNAGNDHVSITSNDGVYTVNVNSTDNYDAESSVLITGKGVAQAINPLTTRIGTAEESILSNKNAISGLDTRVTANFNAIEALEAGMVDWSSLSADAQTAIQAQATVAAKNAIKVNAGNDHVSVTNSDGEFTVNVNSTDDYDAESSVLITGKGVAQAINPLTTRIGTAESAISANASAISGLDTRVTANFNAIEALEAGMVDWGSLSTEAQTAIRGTLKDEFYIRPAATTFSMRSTNLNYVSNNQTVGENLYALDQQVHANATAIAGLNSNTIDWNEINKAIDDKIANAQLNSGSGNGTNTDAGNHTTVGSMDSNVTVTTQTNVDGLHYEVALNKKQELESVTLASGEGKTTHVNGNGIFVGGSDTTDATAYVADGVVSAGQGDKQIVMNGNEGTLKVGKDLTFHSSGKITGVASGTISADSTDAVNGSQLYETQQMIGQNASNIQSLNQQINKTYDKVQRVGAGAAALAALRPQDFSAEHPISGAAGIGSYDGKQAIAVGMFYRPTENLTLGFGASAAGNDDYMMNAGISYRFGGGGSYNAISQSDINQKVIQLTQSNRALVAQIESSMIREDASVQRLNRVQKELKAAQKKAEISEQKLDMLMQELAALREEIQKMKQK